MYNLLQKEGTKNTVVATSGGEFQHELDGGFSHEPIAGLIMVFGFASDNYRPIQVVNCTLLQGFMSSLDF